MYWYNPTTRTSERVKAPSTDEQAIPLNTPLISLLAGRRGDRRVPSRAPQLETAATPKEKS